MRRALEADLASRWEDLSDLTIAPPWRALRREPGWWWRHYADTQLPGWELAWLARSVRRLARHQSSGSGGALTLITNTAETGLSAGTAVTTGNSDDGSAGTAFTTVSVPSGTLTFETADAYRGSLCYYFVQTNGGNAALVDLDDGSASADVTVRFYVRMDDLPTVSNVQFPVSIRHTTNGALARIEMSTTGQVRCQIASSTGSYSASGLSADTWYRFEVYGTGFGTASTSLTVDVYTGDDTGTPLRTATLSGVTTSSQVNRVRYGKISGSPSSVVSFKLDDLAQNVGSATPLGPSAADANASAEVASATGAANNAQVSVAVNAEAATATAAALFDASGGSVSLNLIAQDAITVTAAANDATVTVGTAAQAQVATASAAAHDAGASASPAVEAATVAASAEDVSAGVSASAEAALATAAPLDAEAATSVVVSPGVALADAAAHDATVTRAGNPTPDAAAAGAAAEDAAVSVMASAEVATAAGVAEDGLVSTSGTGNAAALTAAATAEAQDAAVSRTESATAEDAAAGGAALDATVSVSVFPDAASASAVAEDVSSANASAAVAEATGEAPSPSVTISVTAETAAATAAAYDALTARPRGSLSGVKRRLATIVGVGR